MATRKSTTYGSAAKTHERAIAARLQCAITAMNVMREILTDIIVDPKGPESRALIVRDSISLHGRSLEMVYTALSDDRIGCFEDEGIEDVLLEEETEAANG